jgi:hypothetical protein
MSNRKITTQTEKTYAEGEERRLLIVRANGGSLAVEKRVGDNWIVADTFAADGAHLMNFGLGPVRFTPTGGAEYSIE